MKNNLVGCLIITHNPPLAILNKTINKLLEYKDIINIFIIDNSDETIQLKKSIQNLIKLNLINFEHINNTSVLYSFNYGINKIKREINPEFIMFLEDDNMLITDLTEIIKLYYKMHLVARDLVIFNDRSFPLEKHTLIYSKQLIGIGTYFARSALFYNIPLREEFIMDQGDFDFQIKVRKDSGSIFITSWKVIERPAPGREQLPLWRDYLAIRNATVLFLVERNGIIFCFKQFRGLSGGFIINMKKYGVVKFLKIALEAFYDGITKNFDNNKVWEFRKL